MEKYNINVDTTAIQISSSPDDLKQKVIEDLQKTEFFLYVSDAASSFNGSNIDIQFALCRLYDTYKKTLGKNWFDFVISYVEISKKGND